MKLLDKTKWIIIFSVCVLIAIVARPTDMFLARLLYMPKNLWGNFFLNVAPALPFALCSFSCAVLMSCRNTMATRAKNQRLTVIYGLLSAVFALAAAYYPFIGIDEINFVAIAAVAAAICGLSIFLSYTSFKETYQKIVMTRAAKTVLISTVIITVGCALAMLIPQRGSYDAIQLCLERRGNADGPFDSTVPIISAVGASAPVLLFAVCLKDTIPKLKFSGKWIFALSCVWTLAVIFGVILSGRVFLSEACYGAIFGYLTVFGVSEFYNKREK